METEIPSFISKEVQKGDYFFLNLNPKDGESLTIVCGGIEVCGDRYQVNRQAFPYHGLEFVISGNCEVKLEGITRIASSGFLFSYPPNTPLSLRTVGDKPLTKYFVDFTGTQTESLLHRMQTIHHGFVDLSHNSWISENFRQLIDCGKSQQAFGCQLLLRLILSLIPKESRQVTNPTTYEIYQRCRALIDTDFAQLHSLADLAVAVHVSDAYLCRIFQCYHTESPSKAIIRRKMEQAARRLFEGASLIKSVARQVGFEDPYHFSRCFKSHFGVSPKHFTRQTRVPATRDLSD